MFLFWGEPYPDKTLHIASVLLHSSMWPDFPICSVFVCKFIMISFWSKKQYLDPKSVALNANELEGTD
jgi:hypothetical protein